MTELRTVNALATTRLTNAYKHLNRQPWTADAACAGLPPETADALFFDSNGMIPPAAEALCGVCPVSYDCAVFGVSIGAEDGVWGGSRAVGAA